MLTTFVKVLKSSDLPEGTMKAVKAEGEEVLLVRLNGQVYAVNNICTHAEAYLDQGTLYGDYCEVECPIHEGRFDLRTGEPTEGPPKEHLAVYAVREEGDDILVGPAG